MNTPPSRLLMRLDAAIAAEPDPVQADCLRAEQATYMARQGRRADARALLDELHRRYDTRPRVETSVWINFAEGMVDFCCGAGTTTYDRILRAHALSTAANLVPMKALTAGWLAHMEYIRLRVGSMTKYVTAALELAQPDHHSARARSCLVIAQGLHVAARFDLAAPWYARSRDHALSEGDDETMSAIMHNMAGLRAGHLRQHRLTGTGDPKAGDHALLGAESTWNYDRLVGSIGQTTFVPLLRAQILALNGEAAEALDIYRKHIDESANQGKGRLRSAMLADQAWCYATLGELEPARRDAADAIASLSADTHIDDVAATHSRLSQVFEMVGDVDASASHKKLAESAWAEFALLQSQIILELAPIGENGLAR